MRNGWQGVPRCLRFLERGQREMLLNLVINLLNLNQPLVPVFYTTLRVNPYNERG